ncbi:glutamyl aminopeptidase-like [Choristoneura fumiferana]|uniref:glutamyl aminopeptidase-like n=1 Tax=Choristoneura fumiferana TaxID=7141 RepID=UPI003D157997
MNGLNMNKRNCLLTTSNVWLNLLITLGLFNFHHAHRLILRQREEEKPPVIGYRLPRHIAPTNYKLRLSPNATSKTFRGTIEIELSVYNPTNNVTLHTNQLTIESVSLENFFLEKMAVSFEIISDDRQLLIVKSQTTIPDGRYVLKIYFSGILDGSFGVFTTTHKNGGTMVATLFEATHAREAFPCFDEPDFKATFDITIIKPQNYVALSNMNEVSKALDNETGSEAVQFATSVPMSTYLVCFAIGDFDFKETEINTNGIGSNFKLRSFAYKDDIHKVDLAQDIGKRATEFYINYFEVPFPLPKLDMVAIPDYRPTGNWGLITFSEGAFLIDGATASTVSKIVVANVIAHELAHMWFGNLVTMEWWDELWLKEGFASFMTLKCLNAIQPSWTTLDMFLIRYLHNCLLADSLVSSIPIVQIVDTPDQISELYNEITHLKAASILRMLEGFTGKENFRKGVSDYLKKHKFGNTITLDLLASLEPYFKMEHPEQNLTFIMVTWTNQMGYPLLTVLKEADTYLITQSRFLLDPKAVPLRDTEYDYRWFVPITFKTNKGVHEKVLWFDDTTDSVTITEKDVKWLKLNNDQVGYYRVNYPLEMWQSLIEQLKLKSDQLTISDRAHLLNDVFALAEAGVVPYELALNLTTYLPVEEDYVPWRTAASILISLSDRLSESISVKMQTYIQQLVSNIYSKQNWDNNNLIVIDRLLRTAIIDLGARVGLPAAEEKIRVIFQGWINSHSTSQMQMNNTDLRDIVLYYGMKYASHSEWDKLWQMYKNENDAQIQATLLKALTASRNIEILKKYLTLAWDESNVRNQDYLQLLGTFSVNPWGLELVWTYVREHWTQLVNRFTLNDNFLGVMVRTITKNFDTEVRLQEMESFFQQYPEAGAGAAERARALETVRNNIEWAAARAPQITAWLDRYTTESAYLSIKTRPHSCCVYTFLPLLEK